MGAIASQITSLTIVYSAVCSGADERKHQSSASLAFVRGIHRWPVNSPHKWPVTQKVFPFDDVIMTLYYEQGCVTWQTCNDTIKHDDCILTQNCITVTSWLAWWRLKTTSVSNVCSTVCSGADQRNHQNSASLALVKKIHRWPLVPLKRTSNAENISIC